jgi:hypothetical protein
MVLPLFWISILLHRHRGVPHHAELHRRQQQKKYAPEIWVHGPEDHSWQIIPEIIPSLSSTHKIIFFQ